MRRLPLVMAAACLAGCAGGQSGAGPRAPAVAPFVLPSNANFTVSVSESVNGPEEDSPSYLRIFIDGQPAGQTTVSPRSQEKKWGGALPPGNHLFRFEKWDVPPGAPAAPLDSQWQPPERFIRVEPGVRAAAALKFYEGSHKHSLEIAREPLP